MTIHVCVIMNKCGVSVSPTQLVVTASDWKLPREIVVTSDVDSEIRTIQIHHKIHETYDDVYNASTAIPSVFVSVLQKEATFLFVFGCGLHGRLGSNDEENANVPTPFACKWLHPVQIASGKAHSAIIDVYSNIYCFGLGAQGQLGQGDSNLDSSKLPLRVPTVGTSTILHVACGSHHTMCMTTEGKVFAWGDNTSGQLGLGFKSPKPRGIPTRVEKLVNVRGLVCGGSHSFVVMLDNNVLACGSNIAGQLGLGDRKDRAVFERIPFFRKLYAPPVPVTASGSGSAGTSASGIGTSVHSPHGSGFAMSPSAAAATIGDIELASGLYHAMALCGKRVYSWGNGDDGRLGHGNLETHLEPTLVSALSDVPIRSIACGGSHSGAIAANGDVYVWGNGQHGQLGTGAQRSRRAPTKVRLLHNKHVTQLAFGEWHSMALCDGGALYAWGFGEEGQLGLPDDDKRPSRIVPLPTLVHALTGTGATMVRCGGSHTFVVSVLEARRPQLARMHRRTSQAEFVRESDRIAVLARPTAAGARGPAAVPHHDSERKLPHSRSNPSRGESMNDVAAASSSEQLKKKPGVLTRKKSQTERLDAFAAAAAAALTHRDVDDTPRVPLDFSWRDRPLTSRTAVRNALRQEVKALSEAREALTPIPIPTRAKTASSAFMSPRLRRLHDQVLRGTEAGAGLLKCQSIVGTDAMRTSIATAVDTATAAVAQTEMRGLAMTTQRTPRRWLDDDRGNQSATDDGDAPSSLAAMLAELRGDPSKSDSDSDSNGRSSRLRGSEDDSSESDDEICVAGQRACIDLERSVVWQLSSP